MDAWHAMARIKVPKNHGFRHTFARALRDAIFVPDQRDREQISAYLESQHSSWDSMLRTKAKWLWRRCKRIIPPPEQLYPAVSMVFQTFGPLRDAATNAPLFNARAVKDANNVLKLIQGGLLSDPIGINLYAQMGVDKQNGNLPLYRCWRGTNTAEGGVHHSVRRRLPISGASPRHAVARLRDFCLMHNLMVSVIHLIMHSQAAC